MNSTKNNIIASCVSSTITFPIELIKSQYQVSNNSLYNVVKNVYRREGLKGYFNGLSINMLRYPPFWITFFACYDGIFKDKIIIESKMFRAVISGVIGSTISNPLFVITTKMQTSLLHKQTNNKTNNRTSILSIVKEINHKEGIRGYMKGWNSTQMNVMKLGIQMPLNDKLLKDGYGVIYASFIAKIISSSIFYPLDIIRTIQRDSKSSIKIKDIIEKIYMKMGIKGFYRGLIIYNCVTCPNFVIMMYLKSIL